VSIVVGKQSCVFATALNRQARALFNLMRTCCFIQPSMAPYSELPHQPQAKPIKYIRLSCSAKKAPHLCVVEICGLLGCVPRDIAAGLYATGGASCVGVEYSEAANGKEDVQDTVALLQMPHQNSTPHTTAKCAPKTIREQNYMDRNLIMQNLNANVTIAFTLTRPPLGHEQNGTRHRVRTHGHCESARNCASVQFAAPKLKVQKPEIPHWIQKSSALSL
jgi:hypothetical protein